jgi:hypothetical protein
VDVPQKIFIGRCKKLGSEVGSASGAWSGMPRKCAFLEFVVFYWLRILWVHIQTEVISNLTRLKGLTNAEQHCNKFLLIQLKKFFLIQCKSSINDEESIACKLELLKKPVINFIIKRKREINNLTSATGSAP